MNVFNRLLKETRQQLNLSQKKISEKIGIAETTLSMIETGERIPTESQFNAIVKLFNFPEEMLTEIFETDIIDLVMKLKPYKQLKIIRAIELLKDGKDDN